MERRTLLTVALGALSGCVSRASPTSDERTATEQETESDDESPLIVEEWVDSETDPHSIPYSAVRVEAVVDDAPLRTDLIGEFDSGTETTSSRPSDPEIYREDHATDLYPGRDSVSSPGVEAGDSGWIVYHPDEQDARLVSIRDPSSGEKWSREL